MGKKDHLFDNAKYSIQLGFEDYFSSHKDERRLLSAVRNIHAGILLFLKWAIKKHTPNESNTLIIKQHSLEIKNGEIIVAPKGNITIDRKQIIEVLKIINKPLELEQVELLKRIGSIRNDIEHHFTTYANNKLQEYIFDSFWLIKKLRGEYSKITDIDLFGESNYKKLMKHSDSYRRQVELCYEKWAQIDLDRIEKLMPQKVFDISPSQFSPEMQKSLDKNHKGKSEDEQECYRCVIRFLSSIECRDCGSNLVEPINYNSKETWPQLCCAKCNSICDFKDVIEGHLEKFFAYEVMKAGARGGVIALGRCPKCNLGCYVNFLDDEKCLYCGNTDEKPNDPDFEYELMIRNVQLDSDYF